MRLISAKLPPLPPCTSLAPNSPPTPVRLVSAKIPPPPPCASLNEARGLGQTMNKYLNKYNEQIHNGHLSGEKYGFKKAMHQRAMGGKCRKQRGYMGSTSGRRHRVRKRRGCIGRGVGGQLYANYIKETKHGSKETKYDVGNPIYIRKTHVKAIPKHTDGQAALTSHSPRVLEQTLLRYTICMMSEGVCQHAAFVI